MISFASATPLASEHFPWPASRRIARARAQPLAIRLRRGLQLVDQATAALRSSLPEARELAGAALSVAVPSARDEERSETRRLLPIALDVAAAAYTVEAEAWLLGWRIEQAEAPAALARRLAIEGSGDPLVFGGVEAMLGLQAWLRGNLGRSLRHFEEAILHFTEAGDPGREADAWGRAAVVLELAGLQPEAELALSRARRLVEREAEGLLAELLADEPGFHSRAASAVNLISEHGS